MIKHLHRHGTLFAGMYVITITLFWIESGSITTGLLFGLVSATLKTSWSWVHHHLLFPHTVPLVQEVEAAETVEVEEVEEERLAA